MITKNGLKTLTAVAVVGLVCSCQTYYEKHNMLNNKQPCPAGTQADKYGMECKPIVKEVIPENETKLQKFNRFLGKVDDGIKNNEVLNNQGNSNPYNRDCGNALACRDGI